MPVVGGCFVYGLLMPKSNSSKIVVKLFINSYFHFIENQVFAYNDTRVSSLHERQNSLNFQNVSLKIHPCENIFRFL